jgi:hypothetical protein
LENSDIAMDSTLTIAPFVAKDKVTGGSSGGMDSIMANGGQKTLPTLAECLLSVNNSV